jgi:hypothetical protein
MIGCTERLSAERAEDVEYRISNIEYRITNIGKRENKKTGKQENGKTRKRENGITDNGITANEIV